MKNIVKLHWRYKVKKKYLAFSSHLNKKELTRVSGATSTLHATSIEPTKQAWVPKSDSFKHIENIFLRIANPFLLFLKLCNQSWGIFKIKSYSPCSKCTSRLKLVQGLLRIRTPLGKEAKMQLLIIVVAFLVCFCSGRRTVQVWKAEIISDFLL